MKAEYRFLRAHGGGMSFAKVTVVACRAEAWSVELGPLVNESAALHGEALREGIMLAAQEHERRGGGRHRVEVEALAESVVDTAADAVRCAAAMATWKALGRDESEANVSREAGGWQVQFQS